MVYKIGQKVRGEVIGIQPYGVFVSIDEETQGLIHISELKHGYIKSISEVVNKGDVVDVIIMDIDEYSHKISLSLRSLHKPKFHPFSNRRNISRYGNKTGIGFKSIEDKLPGWVELALKEIDTRKSSK
ncbi:CvfD/Ygs/GSP13 family RNA-binding post-transcriptional regulator [Alkalibacterium olivapovliticus]|uniref:General stress protein 13 n=1 Tax=Alkalibacterium olivapovliticus TaxID=99907 RepID=A0A2T0W7V6_9LACT|nr:CvfD/Ygs/GSP13 family RNA-binding post-transcriptional regulator [Alkalibacterium olivapovliticus]PRY82797.1 general stress protein 13 [Alkalibacterium olivapovliticus]